MSREIKYIGMDVHKEAVVIAVLNSNGKLVAEGGDRAIDSPDTYHVPLHFPPSNVSRWA